MGWKRSLKWMVLLATLAAAGASASTATPVSIAAPAAFPGAFEDPDIPLPDPDLWQRVRKGFLLEPLGLGTFVEDPAGSYWDGNWAYANLGVFFALVLSFVVTYFARAAKIRAQESRHAG